MLKRHRTLTCAVCGGVMKHVRTVPAAPKLPELHTFKCACGCMRTVEDESGSEHKAA